MARKTTVYDNGTPLYDILLERDYKSLPEKLMPFGIKNRKLCIVTESNVGSYYGSEIREILTPFAGKVFLYTFPAGESSKNLNTVQALYKALIERRFERNDMLIALGGGVVGDLTGYTAATYLRGIDFVQLPTSLLSQVDSSIGGKTGVDFDCYKNMVGAFYQPRLVYMNLNTLNTLEEREYLSGMGEIIKHGVIKDSVYYSWLGEHLLDIKNRNLDILEEMIYKSCEIKRKVVEEDPKENGDRALLNFGHTLGHAIEKLMDFSLLHGECVALGMAAAMELSCMRGLITREETDSFRKTLESLSLPVRQYGLTVEDIIAASKNDKKMEQGKIKFILLKKIGQAYIDRTVTDEELSGCLAHVIGES